ncbi:MAG: TetR/AcrR family transcriptional regulator [Planctomycetota bacterium]
MSEKAQVILDAAEPMFAEGRYHEVTLDRICEEAGVGKGTIYRYFENKEDLYHQIILRGLDEMVEWIEQVEEECEDPGEGLREAARRLTEFYTEHRSLISLMWSEQFRGSKYKKQVWKKSRRKSDKVVKVLAGFVRRGVQEGRYRLGAFSPAAAARLLMGMLRTGRRHQEQMPGGTQWAQDVVKLFERGLTGDEGKQQG